MNKMYIVTNAEGKGVVVKMINADNYTTQPDEIDITELTEEEKALIREDPGHYQRPG